MMTTHLRRLHMLWQHVARLPQALPGGRAGGTPVYPARTMRRAAFFLSVLCTALLLAGTSAAAPDRTALALPAPGLPGTGERVGVPVQRWDQLSDEQQRQRRAHYMAWRALSPAAQQRVREAAARFAALPPSQQQALRERFNAQDQSFREGWRLGPLLGEYFSRLQGMFGFVPESERATALTVLQQLSPGQVAQLALVAQRTPPQQRDSVRAEFLAVPAAQRDAWLARQVGH